MKARRALLLVAALASVALAAACDENPPEEASPTPTLESPTPGVTPVAVTIPGDGSIAVASGRISEPGEADVFTFTLAQGSKVRVDVDAQGLTPSSANLDAIATLYGPGGNVVAVDDDGTNFWDATTTTPGLLKDPYLVASAGSGGSFTLVLEDANGSGHDDPEFDYRVAFSLVTSTPLAGGVSCGTAVALPALVSSASVLSISSTIDGGTSTDSCCGNTPLPCVGGTVSAKDVLYTASLTSGQKVQITRSGPAFDGAVYVTTACTGGSVPSIVNSCVAGADGSDEADGVLFTPTVTGSYFVFVDGVAGSGGNFTLDLRRVP